MKTLDIRVAFSAVDRLTRPAENARRLMGQFGDSIQRTQGAIKNLERQARSFERARDAVSKADAGILKARRQLNALNQLQRTGTVLSEKQQKLMQQLSTRLERLNESRTREIQKMRELGGELKRHGISLTGSDNTIQQAIRRTEQYNNQLERERQALARVTRARERYSRAQETAGKLKTGGALAIGAAAAGGYAAGRFLQPAIGFGKEMSRVQALTRIDKNSPQFKALREQALKLGSETQFTASDAASGQSFLAMAGFTPQAIQAALPGVLNMALAGGVELGETADIGSNILTQFNLTADQMDRVGVLYGKLATLRLGFDILTRSMNVIRVLPALWGMVTGSVSLLGGAIGALFSPVGLIVAALAGAAVLIWKYWDPIRAFFAGVFSGIMERLTPLRETFERFGPVFDAIGSGISQVFNWFKSLLSPMESSKETLDKCTSAGEIFGNVLGGALQLVLTPAKMLLDTLAWILEKLGVLPDEAERARKKIEDAQRAAILQDKVALFQGDIAKINPPKSAENGNGTGGDKPKDNKPLTDSNTGTLRRLSKIADNTGKLVDETKKRIGPGDIVFKKLPRALAVRGEWQERKIAQVSKPAPAINITPVVPAPLPPALVPVVAASSRPVAEAIRSPVASVPVTSRNREPVASGFGGEIHVHLHNVVTQNPRELAKLVGEMVRAEMERRARAGRGSFYDKD
ncbi:TPA: phage tail tape measure protein [Escherichia coli]|nr:phage tail tape measure protein [Escherichia coli]